MCLCDCSFVRRGDLDRCVRALRRGYLFGNLASGFLCHRFGGDAVSGTAVLLFSCATLCVPYSTSSHKLVSAVRMMEGAFGGMFSPSMQAVAVNAFATPEQRVKFLALVNSCRYGGTIVASILCPLLIKWFSWQTMFQFFGSAGLIWVCVWLQFGRITARENEQQNQVSRRTCTNRIVCDASSCQGVNSDDCSCGIIASEFVGDIVISAL
jgi:MFS family permease